MMRQNVRTENGIELGKQMARLCDVEEAAHSTKRKRCSTCAFRAGDHIANGSPETLMNALKCVMERKVFWCHVIGKNGEQRPCAGWRLMVADTAVQMPWDFVPGQDAPA